MDISIVIPLFNEEESLAELLRCIQSTLDNYKFTYEIILVDDGSTDKSWEVIETLTGQYPALKAIKFRRNYGKAAALNEGFGKAQGDVVITMDADLQDNPQEIPELYSMIRENDHDLVSGWKKKRYDPLTKKIPSKFYNAVLRRMSGLKLHDFNCGLKAYRREVVKNIELSGEMHRYIPVLVHNAGFTNISEKIVRHQPRKFGKSKFGVSRYINGYLDLLTVSFVNKFGKRPMHFFGAVGTLCIIAGFIILLYLSIMRLIYLTYGITDRPLFYLGILLLIIGTQLFATGFLAELVIRNSPDRHRYKVEKTIGLNSS